MEENQTEQPKEEAKKEDSPWSSIAFGLGMIAAGIFLYFYFDNMEKEGGSIRINWIFALAYKIGGKWTVAIILWILGSFLTYSGVSDLIKKKK